MGLSILIGRASFVILTLILISSFFMMEVSSIVLAEIRDLNLLSRAKESYEFLVLSGKTLQFLSVSSILPCQLLDVSGEGL